MAAITVGVGIKTPCGEVQVQKVVNLPGLSFDFSFLLNFPPKFYIPWPDCSIFKRKNSAPEPKEDSHP